jgi:hypothetical protein
MADRSATAAGTRRGPLARLRDIHRICGQVCGQAASFDGPAAFLLPRRRVAEKLSNEKSFQIK